MLNFCFAIKEEHLSVFFQHKIKFPDHPSPKWLWLTGRKHSQALHKATTGTAQGERFLVVNFKNSTEPKHSRVGMIVLCNDLCYDKRIKNAFVQGKT